MVNIGGIWNANYPDMIIIHCIHVLNCGSVSPKKVYKYMSVTKL